MRYNRHVKAGGVVQLSLVAIGCAALFVACNSSQTEAPRADGGVVDGALDASNSPDSEDAATELDASLLDSAPPNPRVVHCTSHGGAISFTCYVPEPICVTETTLTTQTPYCYGGQSCQVETKHVRCPALAGCATPQTRRDRAAKCRDGSCGFGDAIVTECSGGTPFCRAIGEESACVQCISNQDCPTSQAPYCRTDKLQSGCVECRNSADCSIGTCSNFRCITPSVGCSDGVRDAFLDQTTFPGIAGCKAAFSRQPMLKPKTGTPCGNDLNTACATPADACAAGWHVCGAPPYGTDDLTQRVSAEQCQQQPSRFAAALPIDIRQHASCDFCDDGSTPDNGGVACCGTDCLRASDVRCTPIARSFGTVSCGMMEILDATTAGVLCCHD